MSNSTVAFLRGSLPSFPQPGSEEYNRLLQFDLSRLTRDCQELEVVDACRATNVRREYIGNFKPYEGSCRGDLLDGFPIYYNAGKKLYMYALDVYPDYWQTKALRGLVRWRIASFKNFEDKETCRRESANIFQIDFAADGQPYNFFPTITCFDDRANDGSGHKVSTINIQCNDGVVIQEPPQNPSPDDDETTTPVGGGGGDSGGGDGGGNLSLVIGIIAILLLIGVCAYWYIQRRKKQGKSPFPWVSADDEETRRKKAEKQQQREAKKKAKEEAKLEAQRKSEEEKVKKQMEKEAALASDTSTEKESKDEPPVRFVQKHEPVKKHPPEAHKRELPKQDPPARVKTGADDDAVPDEIQKMVADLDTLLDDELKDSVVSRSKPRGRSRSLEPQKSSTYADKKNTRSRSLERAKANAMDYFDRSANTAANLYDGLLKRAMSMNPRKPEGESTGSDDDDRRSRSRSQSIERSRDREAERDRGRSRSMERSRADDYARDRARSRSAERSRARDYADRGRSRSKERSQADDYATRDRGRSREPPETEKYMLDRNRSRSKERSKADDCARDRGRSRSKERSRADDYANRDRGRSRSIERAKASDYGKDRGRSTSRERSKAHDYATKVEKHRPRSLEPAGATLNANAPKLKNPTGSSQNKSGVGPIGEKTVEKNPDGSVLVSQRRRREDGAIVTTKTKYASVGLARKHGINV